MEQSLATTLTTSVTRTYRSPIRICQIVSGISCPGGRREMAIDSGIIRSWLPSSIIACT
jgi:hypothetical protein